MQYTSAYVAREAARIEGRRQEQMDAAEAACAAGTITSTTMGFRRDCATYEALGAMTQLVVNIVEHGVKVTPMSDGGTFA
jgi:hypothetical protein